MSQLLAFSNQITHVLLCHFSMSVLRCAAACEFINLRLKVAFNVPICIFFEILTVTINPNPFVTTENIFITNFSHFRRGLVGYSFHPHRTVLKISLVA
jgi:hypothetical protein